MGRRGYIAGLPSGNTTTKYCNTCIATGERYPAVKRDPDLLEELLSAGVLRQVNAVSIVGYSSGRAGATEWRLLRSCMAHIVASDAYSPRSCVPRIASGYDRISSLADVEYADWVQNASEPSLTVPQSSHRKHCGTAPGAGGPISGRPLVDEVSSVRASNYSTVPTFDVGCAKSDRNCRSFRTSANQPAGNRVVTQPSAFRKSIAAGQV